MSKAVSSRQDSLDHVLAQWRHERPDLDLDLLAIVGRLARLGAHLELRLSALAERVGLNRGQVDVLGALRRCGAPYRLSPTELFNSLMVSSGCMTHRLDRLEQEGLVERLRDPDDRRGLLVGLTPKGRVVIDRLLPAIAGVLEGLPAELGPRERQQFAELLRRTLAMVEAQS